MVSQALNVLRYSALVGGIAYGVMHQRTIRAADQVHHAEREYQNKQELLKKARMEWTKKTTPASAMGADGKVITDPMDPKFDLEAYLKLVSANEARA